MSSVTEIYVCKPEQELKKGKLFTSQDIHTRQEAELDARERCRIDDRIAKIAYYALQEDGAFKKHPYLRNSGCRSQQFAVERPCAREFDAVRSENKGARAGRSQAESLVVFKGCDVLYRRSALSRRGAPAAWQRKITRPQQSRLAAWCSLHLPWKRTAPNPARICWRLI